MRIDGRNFDVLAKDFEAARIELMMAYAEPGVWTRSRPGKWTGGQHVEHVALLLVRCTADFRAALAQMRQGALPSPPARGPLQALFIATVVKRGMMPRGGGAPSWGMPSPTPNLAIVSTRLLHGIKSLLMVGEDLDPESRDTLWIWNRMVSFRWHYRYPEMVRVQAVHFRHHAAQVRELAR